MSNLAELRRKQAELAAEIKREEERIASVNDQGNKRLAVIDNFLRELARWHNQQLRNKGQYLCEKCANVTVRDRQHYEGTHTESSGMDSCTIYVEDWCCDADKEIANQNLQKLLKKYQLEVWKEIK